MPDPWLYLAAALVCFAWLVVSCWDGQPTPAYVFVIAGIASALWPIFIVLCLALWTSLVVGERVRWNRHDRF